MRRRSQRLYRRASSGDLCAGSSGLLIISLTTAAAGRRRCPIRPARCSPTALIAAASAARRCVAMAVRIHQPTPDVRRNAATYPPIISAKSTSSKGERFSTRPAASYRMSAPIRAVNRADRAGFWAASGGSRDAALPSRRGPRRDPHRPWKSNSPSRPPHPCAAAPHLTPTAFR